jgi:transposase
MEAEMTVKVIGLDIAKNVFQVHGVNEAGEVVVRRKLRRSDVLRWFAEIDPAMVGVEACQTAHYWARELVALGHDVRLMPPQFVKPYVKSQKNDAADAEAICEAVQRPTMRFVPIKSAEQQAALLLHRTRDLLIRQRSSLISAIRAHFAEFGIVASRGIRDIDRLLQLLTDSRIRLPELAREMLGVLASCTIERASGIRLSKLHRTVQALRQKLPLHNRAGYDVVDQQGALATVAGQLACRTARLPPMQRYNWLVASTSYRPFKINCPSIIRPCAVFHSIGCQFMQHEGKRRSCLRGQLE